MDVENHINTYGLTLLASLIMSASTLMGTKMPTYVFLSRYVITTVLTKGSHALSGNIHHLKLIISGLS